jgi:hypothetical protein
MDPEHPSINLSAGTLLRSENYRLLRMVLDGELWKIVLYGPRAPCRIGSAVLRG